MSTNWALERLEAPVRLLTVVPVQKYTHTQTHTCKVGTQQDSSPSFAQRYCGWARTEGASRGSRWQGPVDAPMQHALTLTPTLQAHR